MISIYALLGLACLFPTVDAQPIKPILVPIPRSLNAIFHAVPSVILDPGLKMVDEATLREMGGKLMTRNDLMQVKGRRTSYQQGLKDFELPVTFLGGNHFQG